MPQHASNRSSLSHHAKLWNPKFAFKARGMRQLSKAHTVHGSRQNHRKAGSISSNQGGVWPTSLKEIAGTALGENTICSGATHSCETQPRDTASNMVKLANDPIPETGRNIRPKWNPQYRPCPLTNIRAPPVKATWASGTTRKVRDPKYHSVVFRTFRRRRLALHNKSMQDNIAGKDCST